MPSVIAYARQDPAEVIEVIKALASSEAGAWQLAKLYTFIYPNIETFSRSSDPALIINKIKEILDEAVHKGLLPSSWVGSISGWETKEAAIAFFTFLIELLKSPITLKITCPPMFHLSSASMFLKQVVVLINTGTTITNKANRAIPKTFNRVLSGVYVVTGFKHTITKSKVQSEFLMYRDPFDLLHFLHADVDSMAAPGTVMNIEPGEFRIDNFA
jgi:hypothetical protein